MASVNECIIVEMKHSPDKPSVNGYQPKKSLLLVVDVQNGFVNDDTKHILEPINTLIRRWRHEQAPIVFSRFINPESGPWERLMGWDGCRSDPEIRLHPNLEVDGGPIIDKHVYSSWTNEVADYCKKRALDTVLLCGIDTDQCVLATAVDIFQTGLLKPLIVSDCCASSAGDKFHQAGLLLLERLIGKKQIVPCAVL